jgi:putative membrane protein
LRFTASENIVGPGSGKEPGRQNNEADEVALRDAHSPLTGIAPEKPANLMDSVIRRSSSLRSFKCDAAAPHHAVSPWALFRSDCYLQIAVITYACIWFALAINPASRSDWLLENLLVFAAVPVLFFAYRVFQFSHASYSLIFIFLLLHAYGAHYTYSETPIGNLLRDVFSLERNHYDRFVHLAFGFLLCKPVQELLAYSRCPRRPSFWISPLLLLAGSSVYEIIESVAAVISSPELGAMYLGSQGDIWDAQKDIALGWGGAALWSVFQIVAAKLKR